MAIETIRISQRAKEQLIQLKRATGIKTWNVLCRWAYCASLAEPTPPVVMKIQAQSSVEMTFRVFGGAHAEVYMALLKARCWRDGLPISDDVLAVQLRLHLHRGIGYLLADKKMRGISGLFRRFVLGPADAPEPGRGGT